MKAYINKKKKIGNIDPMIYGHFIEHFHRQIYGGIYDPSSRFADEDGFRTDVLDAMRNIKVPILRWPGGCFVSSYNWKKAVGDKRTPFFDKSWRVEDPNSFGTDEYIKLCRKIGCEPYICTNAGTGTAEEMSDWVEYCNLKNEGEYAKWRIANGHTEPHGVKFWSVGNENWGRHEIGAKDANEWGRLVEESAKMMLHVDPRIQLSAAALTNPDWNFNLLKTAGKRLKWISINNYYDPLWDNYAPSDYATSIVQTNKLGQSISKVRGALMMLGLDKQIKIAYDEWNLRGWHHPYSHRNLEQGADIDKLLGARDKNDTNATYTTADSVFAACFLNECIRNCDIVGMANFAPAVNTTGAIFTHNNGIVKRSTYYVFEVMTKYMGDLALDMCVENIPVEVVSSEEVKMIDIAAAKRSNDDAITVSAVNKHDSEEIKLELEIDHDSVERKSVTVYTVNGDSKDSYNDIDDEQVCISSFEYKINERNISISLAPHSVNIIVIK